MYLVDMLNACGWSVFTSFCFRYLREFALVFHDDSLIIFVDDKHCLKIGEPGLPVAGRRVVAGLNSKVWSSRPWFHTIFIGPQRYYDLWCSRKLTGNFYRVVPYKQMSMHLWMCTYIVCPHTLILCVGVKHLLYAIFILAEQVPYSIGCMYLCVHKCQGVCFGYFRISLSLSVCVCLCVYMYFQMQFTLNTKCFRQRTQTQ